MNSHRNPKELKDLIEQSKSDVLEQPKKIDVIVSHCHKKLRNKTEVDLLNSQLEEQNRLIAYYKVSLFINFYFLYLYKVTKLILILFRTVVMI